MRAYFSALHEIGGSWNSKDGRVSVESKELEKAVKKRSNKK